MALIYNALFTTSSIGSNRCLSLPTNAVTPFVSFPGRLDPGRRRWSSGHRRMVVQQAFQGSPATYAKEMERLSAKESLLLAFKDAGGFDALVTGKTTDVQRIDVNERITSLERLNPTPRPTTSPFLEGRWNFEWFGSGSPGLVAAKFIFERFPSNLANLSRLDAVIKDGNADITASMKLLFSIETKFILSSKLTVEGPLRMKEEYVEGIIETPKIIEETVPDQLKGALGQAVSTVQQLPVSVRDVFSSGFKIPLSGTFQRLFMISYLDEEILFDGYLKDCCHYEINASFLFLHCIFIHRFLDDEYSCRKLIANIIRDTFGIPEVLTRWDVPVSSPAEPITEYES